ncbi:uncharacterized protein LOC123888939 [Trifolium pratense]|nr:uncharacterized protein LOC123888939 [Trifolium pratense]
MAAKTKTEEEVTLKLLVNKDTNKVLFAEAEKEFVDALFSFLTFPLGTIARLVEKESSMGSLTIGCLNSLYHCVEDLEAEACLGTRISKEMLLQPANSSECYCNTLKLNIDDTEPTKYFVCTNFPTCEKNSLGIAINKYNCNKCGNPLNRSVLMKHFSNGFVKNGATFIITDELSVMAISMDITNFCLFQNLGIKSASSVKEMSVSLTKEKAIDLLKCSLFSKTPLTDMFLGKNKVKMPSIERSSFFSCDFENNGENFEIIVKLVTRKSDGKLLYAQGEHDFVNILLSFLTSPLGGIVGLLRGSSLGSIDALHSSVADLDKTKYFVSEKAKNAIADPLLAQQYYYLSKDILSNTCTSILSNRYASYYCYYKPRDYNIEGIGRYQTFITNEPTSYLEYDCILYPHTPNISNEGYVKGPRIYVATDDLVIAPLSPITLLNLLNRFETSFEDLTEKVVTIGIKECLSILKAALTSTSALSNGLAHLLTEVKEEICENN